MVIAVVMSLNISDSVPTDFLCNEGVVISIGAILSAKPFWVLCVVVIVTFILLESLSISAKDNKGISSSGRKLHKQQTSRLLRILRPFCLLGLFFLRKRFLFFLVGTRVDDASWASRRRMPLCLRAVRVAGLALRRSVFFMAHATRAVAQYGEREVSPTPPHAAMLPLPRALRV